MSERMRILQASRLKDKSLPASVPWDWVSGHEAQALENHDQTLEGLNGRGGVGYQELLAIMLDTHWSKLDLTEELAAKIVRKFETKLTQQEAVAEALWKAVNAITDEVRLSLYWSYIQQMPDENLLQVLYNHFPEFEALTALESEA